MDKKAIRLDVLRRVITDAKEVPESIKTYIVPTADKEILEELVLKFKIPIHERIDEAYFREDPEMVQLRENVQKEVDEKKRTKQQD